MIKTRLKSGGPEPRLDVRNPVALDLDHPVLNGPTGPKSRFEFFSDGLKPRRAIGMKTRNNGDRFSRSFFQADLGYRGLSHQRPSGNIQ